jgi:hypothetical protein
MVCESTFVLKRKAHSSCTVHRVCPIIPVNANDAMSNGKGKIADCPVYCFNSMLDPLKDFVVGWHAH